MSVCGIKERRMNCLLKAFVQDADKSVYVPAGAARKHFSVASLLERTEFHLEV